MAYPGKKINNPLTGQIIVFLQTAEDTEGQLLEMETLFQPFSKEPPEHYHPYQNELFTVISGELTVRVNGVLQKLTPGQQICIPRNTHHSMWNNAGRTTMVNWKVMPALETETFLENAMGLAVEGKTDKYGKPSLLQVALMAKRFEAEFRFSAPSILVQRALFGLLQPIAKLAGYKASYKKYIN